MFRILLLFFALTWISACIGCGTTPTPETPHRELAAQLEAETVALVRLVDADGNDDANGRPRVFCAGVWVSPTEYLTAAHCVESVGKSDLARFMEQLGLESDEPFQPIGMSMLFAEPSDVSRSSYWTSRVTGFSKDLDLALIAANLPVPRHPYARISNRPIEDGDRVEVVGHTAGHMWSYLEGYVSATRPAEPNANAEPMPTLQVQAPISGGNSGGGAFDANGELIGIASYTEQHAAGMGFFVHRDALRRFLSGR